MSGSRFTDASVDVSPLVPDIVPTATGAPCGLNANGEALGGCSAGETCLTDHDGYPNGYCAPTCVRERCPEGSICDRLSATQAYCLRTCQTDSDCRASEGYACRLLDTGTLPACIPNDHPLGHRENGRACYASGEGDAGVGPFLAPPPSRTFDGTSVSVSRGRTASLAEAQPALQLDPHGGTLAAFIGYDADGHWSAAFSRMDAQGQLLGRSSVFRDHDFLSTLEPSVAFDSGGELHAIYLADSPFRPGDPVRHVTSADDAMTFANPVRVFGAYECNNGCVSAAGAHGLDPDGVTERSYAVGIASRNDGGASVLFTRSSITPNSFEPSTSLAEAENTVDSRRVPAVASVTAGPANGAVTVAWIATNTSNPLSALGDVENRVRLRSSDDGGRTWGPVREITRSHDSPVVQVPVVVSGASSQHIEYVNGGLTGAWDVVLATSADRGVHWVHRVVNDDPDRCATHAFVGLAADAITGDAHVIWLDNRFGPGEVAYARCPADSSERCSRNELVSTSSFVFGTSLDPLEWHGTRSALMIDTRGTLWAAWSDTRSGGPGIYVARSRL